MGEPVVTALSSRQAALSHLRSLVADAREQVLLAVPATVVEDVRPTLRAAAERDILVLTLLDTVEDGPDIPASVGDLGTVVRTRRRMELPFTMATADHTVGVVADGGLLATGRGVGVAFESRLLRHMTVGNYMGNHWTQSVERHAPSPLTTETTFSVFRWAVIRATVSLRERRPVGATVDAVDVATGEPRELEGAVVNTRQRFVDPNTASFPGEVSLALRTDDGRVTVGGPNAAVEDYEARTVTLWPED